MYKSNPTSKNQKERSGSFKKIPFYKAILSLVLCLCFAFSLTLSSPALNGEDLAPCISSYQSPIMLYPGGMPFGVRFNTLGLIVVGISVVDTKDGAVCPAKRSGLMTGDVITKVNSTPVNTPEELCDAINPPGNLVELEITREGKTKHIAITPQKSVSDGLYHLGVFVRNQCAGIGTVSYITPNTLEFAGLGHGICDQDTGGLIPFLSGEVTSAVISQVIKGRVGAPGELRGYLSHDCNGKLSGNLSTGIYGRFDSMPSDLYYSSPIPAATKDQVTTGMAEILCTTDSGKISKYTISIEKIDMADPKHKNFAITVTDKALLDITGGIVQGMSGSPIIQNGRLVGAVTHVLVDDPTSGYGIFIGNMLGISK
ncbi:MAG: SpoIVB peptidase [Clostridia bacterium]|nr:SpoIVB peptidase [Clostridia bacterium]